MNVLPETCGAH